MANVITSPIPVWIVVWIAVIAVIKAVSVVCGFVMYKKPIVLHTFMNRAAGVCLFLLPLTLWLVDLKYSAPVVCALASVAAVQEGHLIRTERIKKGE